MRPSVVEQLTGSCRILETVVAPCVDDPFARTILGNLVANLRMLAGALPGIAPFLREDNAETARLLEQLREAVPAELQVRIANALAEPDADPADSIALDDRNTALRALLAEAVGQSSLTPDQHRSVLRRMTERAARAPMRYVATSSPSA